MSSIEDAMYRAMARYVWGLWAARTFPGERSEIKLTLREMRRLRYGYAVARYRPRTLVVG